MGGHRNAGHYRMSRIEDYKDAELWTVETTLRERYGRTVPYELADSEVRLRASDRDLNCCPIVYWEVNGCHFVIAKTGDRRYRAQFFYGGFEQFGTGIKEYDDLTECAVSLLQAQSDHERSREQQNQQDQ